MIATPDLSHDVEGKIVVSGQIDVCKPDVFSACRTDNGIFLREGKL